MTYQDELKSYREMPQNTIIIDPGKFQGEARYVPELYDASMERDVDIEDDEDGSTFYIVNIVREDITAFPELAGYKTIAFYEDDQGFVYHELRK